MYARNNERDGEQKEKGEDLRDTLDGCNKNGICVVMRDLTAKVGSDSNGFGRTMGTHGQGCRMTKDREYVCSTRLMDLSLQESYFPRRHPQSNI